MTCSTAKRLTSTEDTENVLHTEQEVTEVVNSQVSTHGPEIVNKTDTLIKEPNNEQT